MNQPTDLTPRKHIAVLIFPFGSHPGVLLSLVRRLAAAAPDTTFSFFNTAKSNSSLFSEPGVNENIKPYEVEDGLPEGYVFRGNPVEPIDLFLKGAFENFEAALKRAEKETGKEIGCLMNDSFLWFGGELAKQWKIDWVPVFAAGPRSLFVHLETDLIRRTIGTSSGNEDKSIDFLPGFSSFRVADLPEGIVHGDLSSPFAIMLEKMVQKLSQATALVVNSFEECDLEMLNVLKPRFQKLLSVGPFNLTSPSPLSSADDHGCLQWLNKHKLKSVAYIAFGSFITPPDHELLALAEALDESGIPFLWSFRGNPKNKLPNEFLERTKERGKFVPWAPQMQVLAHGSVGVLISHGGWNSIWESVVCEVPLICRPFVGDHGMNSRRVEVVWGIGLGVEGRVFTKDGVMKALEFVFLGKRAGKIRENIRVLKENLLKAIESNGSSTVNFNALVEVVAK